MSTKLKVNKDLLKKVLMIALVSSLVWNYIISPIILITTGVSITIPMHEVLQPLMLLL